MPQSKTFDAVVVGVGGMGSAAVYHLTKRGLHVLGIEQFDIPHAQGSSHGVTRIIRKAYFEHASYVPLLLRSYELWRELEAQSGESLLHITGSVDVGRPGSRVLDGSLHACRVHGLDHELLDASELHRRFPAYLPPDDLQAVFQPDGGFLLSEQCIVSYCFEALNAGAEIHGRESILSWNVEGGTVSIETTKGRYNTPRMIVTAGAWAGKVVPTVAAVAVPERQVLGWFQPTQPPLFETGRFPVFNMAVDEGHFYGFPIYGVPGFKLGRYHHLEETVDPDAMNRDVNEQDETVLRDFVARYFPSGFGPTLSLKICMFTNTADEHFIVDSHPQYPQVTIAAGFSGHGFKFASVVGEVLADLAIDGATKHDISLFTLSRF